MKVFVLEGAKGPQSRAAVVPSLWFLVTLPQLEGWLSHLLCLGLGGSLRVTGEVTVLRRGAAPLPGGFFSPGPLLGARLCAGDSSTQSREILQQPQILGTVVTPFYR